MVHISIWIGSLVKGCLGCKLSRNITRVETNLELLYTSLRVAWHASLLGQVKMATRAQTMLGRKDVSLRAHKRIEGQSKVLCVFPAAVCTCTCTCIREFPSYRDQEQKCIAEIAAYVVNAVLKVVALEKRLNFEQKAKHWISFMCILSPIFHY